LAINKNKAIADAQRLAARGSFGKAAELLVQVLAEDPEDVRLWLKLGDYQKQNGSIAGAVSAYLKAATHYTDRGFFLKAVACWKQILNSDPNYVDGHLRLAELYVQLNMGPDAIAQYQVVAAAYEREGRPRDAVGVMGRVCELSPEDVPARIRLAEGLARVNDLANACSEFRVVIDQLEARDRLDDLIQVAERVVYLAPDDLGTLRRLSDAYLRKGDAKRALARLQLVFKSSPNDVETLELLARAFSGLGQTHKAVSVHREVARIYEEMGNHAGKLEAYRRLLALDPTDVEAISAVGGGQRGTGSMQAVNPQILVSHGTTSTQGMQRLAMVQPTETLSPEAQIHRHLLDIELLLKYGLGEHALAVCDKILGLDPEHEGALTKRKDLALAIGRRDEAIQSLLKLAAVLERRSPEIAMAHLGELLQLSPNHHEGNQRMQRLSQGMAKGLERGQAARSGFGGAPAVIEAAPLDDYADLDLNGLDLGDADLLAPQHTPDPSVDLDGFGDLDALDAFDAPDPPPAPAGGPYANALELPADDAAVAEEDFAGLVDAPEDDFSDLLRDESRAASAPLPTFVPRRFDTGAQAVLTPPPPDAEAFGALLTTTTASPPAVAPDGTGEFDLPPLDLADDEFGDLLRGETAAPADGDDDFGGLLGDSDELSTPRPTTAPVAPIDVERLRRQSAETSGSSFTERQPITSVGRETENDDLFDPDAFGLPEAGEADDSLPDDADHAARETDSPESTREVTPRGAATPAVVFDGLGDLLPDDLDLDGTDFRNGDLLAEAGRAAVENDEVELEAEVASLPGVELSLGVPESLGPMEPAAPNAARDDDDDDPFGDLDLEPSGVQGESAEEEDVELLDDSELLDDDELLPEDSGSPAGMAIDFDQPAVDARSDSIELPDGFDLGDFHDGQAGLPIDFDAEPAAVSEPEPEPLPVSEARPQVDTAAIDVADFDESEPTAFIASALEPMSEPAPAPRRPMIDARTEVAGPELLRAMAAASEDALAEVDFLLESGLVDDARDALDEVERQYGATNAVQARRGRLQELQALQNEAESAIQQIAVNETPLAPPQASTVGDLNDADIAAHFDLGVAYMEMGQYKKAISQLEKVLSSRERRAEALRVIALCELHQGNASAAVARLQDALRSPALSRDSKVGLHYDLASAYESQGSRLAARQQLQNIVELGAGDFLDTRTRLARLGG
jgi:tetratricopeptide (TPR) repeat protein